MKTRSLRLQLVAGAVGLCLVALGAAGAAIVYVFASTVKRDQAEDLGAVLDRVSVALSRPGIELDTVLLDPRYSTPGGGLYYQVDDQGSGDVLRSRSLWDMQLQVPDPGTEGDLLADAAGPNGQTLTMAVRNIQVPEADGSVRQLRLAVAEDVELRGQSIQTFTLQTGGALLLVGAALSIAGWVMVTLGLRPLLALRDALAGIAEGRIARVDETVPTEFLPVVRQVNALLDVHERTIQTSRDRADDLAHGLKTPLAVMRATAERLREAGDDTNAAGLELLSAEMADRIDYQLRLTHLRIRSRSLGMSSSLDQALIRSVAVMRKTGRGAELFWNLATQGVDADIDSHDLMELVGVLLENAAKWAASEVQITCSLKDRRAVFVVADDGPGVSHSQIEQLGQRGRRLDESKPGSGIGLAVAMEIARLNSGSVTLEQSDRGGLRVMVMLPTS